MSNENLKLNLFVLEADINLQLYLLKVIQPKQVKNFLICESVQCNRKKSLIVSDNTIAAEELEMFFENLARSSAKAGKILATILMKNTGWALENGAKIGSPAVSKSP